MILVSAIESGLPMETVFLCFQLRSLDPSRFLNQPAGRLFPEKMQEIEAAVKYCLGLS